MRTPSLLVALLALQSSYAIAMPKAQVRWELPKGRIAFQPICAKYRAPILPSHAEGGVVPAYLFGVNGASSDEINRMAAALHANGFTISDGYSAINGVWILFAVGEGVVRTQPTADRLFNVMCSLQFEHVRLVHARYNSPTDKFRMT